MTQTTPTVQWNAESGRAVLTNGRIELVIETKNGLNPNSLRDLRTGQAFADRDYSWPGGVFPKLQGPPKVGARSISFKGRLGALTVQQSFAMPRGEAAVLIETVRIENGSANPLDTAAFKCGFVKAIGTDDIRVCPVPYRRETNGQIQEFALAGVAAHGSGFAGWMEPVQPTATWGAEGWVWSKGDASLLIAKYNADSMEWSLMEPLVRAGETQVRFGGAGQWKHGHPEPSARLAPGASYTFGETRLQIGDGDWKHAYYAYRAWTESKGCKTPQGYDPPVHWNKLYDNEYFHIVCAACDRYAKPDGSGVFPALWAANKKHLTENYTRDMMLAEAANAKELGCQALYMDPGWDTNANQQIWDEARLGPLKSWVEEMRAKFGLKVAVWCSMGEVPPTYGDPEACPPDARVLDRDGKMTDRVCCPSPAYIATKEKRLLALANAGIAFFMFDSDQFSGPCWDSRHGHHLPSTREDHANALIELAQRLRAKHPELFIELHDPISGPSGIHYTPTYFGYARPHSFTELWARVHVGADRRHPLAPCVEPVLLQPRLQHSPLPPCELEVGRRKRAGVLVVREHVPALGRRRKAGGAGLGSGEGGDEDVYVAQAFLHAGRILRSRRDLARPHVGRLAEVGDRRLQSGRRTGSAYDQIPSERRRAAERPGQGRRGCVQTRGK